MGDVVTLSFYAKDDGYVLDSYVDNSLTDGSDQVNLFLKRRNPLKKPLRQGTYYGYTFIDKNTVYNASGSKRPLTDEDMVTIIYSDKTVKIKIKDLADGSYKAN